MKLYIADFPVLNSHSSWIEDFRTKHDLVAQFVEPHNLREEVERGIYRYWIHFLKLKTEPSVHDQFFYRAILKIELGCCNEAYQLAIWNLGISE